MVFAGILQEQHNHHSKTRGIISWLGDCCIKILKYSNKHFLLHIDKFSKLLPDFIDFSLVCIGWFISHGTIFRCPVDYEVS